MASSGRPLIRQACNECSRKKIRCDMRCPKCSLCSRIGSTCTYRGQSEQGPHRQSTAARNISVAMVEPAENHLDRRSLIRPEGIRINEIDAPFYDFQSIDDSTTGFLDIRNELGLVSPGMTPWSEVLPIDQECFASPVQQSPVECEIDNTRYTSSISPRLADELIDLYFEKVQGICPLFLREKFDDDFLSCGTSQEARFCGLSHIAQFVLNGMFALSARYSASYEFAGVEPNCRDQYFVSKATELWESIQKHHRHSIRTLQCLQGLTILAFSTLQSGPSEAAWGLTGACVRLAYDLDLHTLDASKTDSEDIRCQEDWKQRWVLLEEKRRVWWMIWEMDTFSSAISMRPFGIDGRVVQVLLPVSDHNWIHKTQAPSAFLDSMTRMPWQSLSTSSNQCERAWFLVCLAVLRQAVDAVLSKASTQALHNAETTIGCVFLALPSSFHNLSISTSVWQTNMAGFNWMACSIIALNWYADLEPKKGGRLFLA